ncbi:hypothetical protein PG991_008363 [Apiospora marii]|uniref:Rhodopsin domain-containing protein n=1 Tax=Apiospora marii TaxID=335849 RepID=A0ABR1RR26_9PEZI
MADDPLNAPAMDPPPGEVQDLDNPPNKNYVVVSFYTVCLIIVSIFVALRLYSKFILLKMARTPDYLFILLLPQGIIWKFQITRQKRVYISFVFALGAISVAAAIARTVLAYLYAESADVAYHFSQAGVFCLVEMTAAILVLTVPTVSKPTKYLAKQATSSLDKLLRSGHRDGSSRTRSNAYQQRMNEPDSAVPLIKARSSRSNKSSRAGSHGTGDEV